MFVRGLGDYVQRGWKVDDWLKPNQPSTAMTTTVKTAAVVGGGLGLAALAAAAWYLLKK